MDRYKQRARIRVCRRVRRKFWISDVSDVSDISDISDNGISNNGISNNGLSDDGIISYDGLTDGITVSR